MRNFLFLLVSLSFTLEAADNLVLVTLDGVRWQELFSGADETLISNKSYVKRPQDLQAAFWAETAEKRREKLFPFIWQTIASKGVLIGDRSQGSNMSVANPWYFSYPGYSEIVTGIADERLDSNKKVLNPNVSFIEYLNNQPEYQGKLAVFGGWDVFPYIFNQPRSQLHVNAGFTSAHGYSLSERVQWLNELQKQIPSPWHNVRLDAFTYGFAKDYLLTVKPKVIMIALGETDDFAHDGRYDHYLHSANSSDAFIQDLWQTLQSTPGYKNNTNLIISTDHGRGSRPNDWQHHASVRAVKGYLKALANFQHGIVGAEHIWLAAIGPDIKSAGLIKPKQMLYQKQIAATALVLLSESPRAFNPHAAPPIMEIIK